MKIKFFLQAFTVLALVSSASHLQAGVQDNIRSWIYGHFNYKPLPGDVSPFYVVQDTSRGHYKNHVRILDSGLAALYARLDMIQRAKSSIDMEYFILTLRSHLKAQNRRPYIHSSTKLILKALVNRINRNKNFRVRILVDASKAFLDLDHNVVSVIKGMIQDPSRRKNFKVAYYNSKILGMIEGMGSLSNFRTHRKIFLSDGGHRECLTGGRNLEDKYYDMYPKYNFDDRDIKIEGTICKTMQDSFEKVWQSRVVSTPPPQFHTYNPSHQTQNWLMSTINQNGDASLTSAEKTTLSGIQTLGQKAYASSAHGECPITTFVSDKPINSRFDRWRGFRKGVTQMWNTLSPGEQLDFKKNDFPSYKNDFRFVERIMQEQALRLQKGDSLLIASPYIVPNNRMKNLTNQLLKKGVALKLYSNSLAATDVFFVSAPFYRRAPKWLQSGIEIHMHRGQYNGQATLADYAPLTNSFHTQVPQATYGMHSKTQVYGDQSFYIGTYNLDNRSSFYNIEMGIFCEGNPKLTRAVRDNIEKRIAANNMQLVLNPHLNPLDPDYPKYSVNQHLKVRHRDGSYSDTIYGDVSPFKIKAMKASNYLELLEILL